MKNVFENAASLPYRSQDKACLFQPYPGVGTDSCESGSSDEEGSSARFKARGNGRHPVRARSLCRILALPTCSLTFLQVISQLSTNSALRLMAVFARRPQTLSCEWLYPSRRDFRDQRDELVVSGRSRRLVFGQSGRRVLLLLTIPVEAEDIMLIQTPRMAIAEQSTVQTHHSSGAAAF